MSLKHVFSVLTILCATASLSRGESESIGCARIHWALAPPDSSDHRKYAPDREIDILHLALDVTPDFQQRTVSGTATLRFKPISKTVREVQLDAVELSIRSVTSPETIEAWHATDKHVIITFAAPLAIDKETTLTIAYSAEPRRGLYFRTPEMGYPAGDTQIWTQGEPIEARHWYPCFDAPNEKFTSEITCRVPEGMLVLSNGRKLSEQKDAQNGLVAVRWLQDKPHVNYLITLCAGYFAKIEDRYRDIPLAFYTPPSEAAYAKNSFRGTKEMMAFFEEETGVPYPWAKYDQVCVHDFVAGGMENTSQTTLTLTTLFPDEWENIRTSEGLVAHELAHQWFGDLVTCKDWSHLWLNEGFATYYEALYDLHAYGKDEFLYNMLGKMRGFIDTQNDTVPIVWRRFDSPNEQFGFRAYPKGAWVLHMLRSQLGPDVYRRSVKTFLDRHQFGNVVTEDLRAAAESVSGRSLDQFFDQWVYHAHHPELDIAYSWDQRARMAKLTVKQVQKLSDDVLLFKFPVTVRFKSKGASLDREIVVKEKEEDFYFVLPEAPEIVRFDPEFTVLAKVKFSPPTPMLHAQLADASDVIGRILAIEQLGARKDKDSVAKLKHALNNDPFWAVRSEASSALRLIHTDEAFAALTNSLKQADARVRNRMVTDLNTFFSDESHAVALKIIQDEKNPLVAGNALRRIGSYRKPENRELIVKHLGSKSYSDEQFEAAVAAIRDEDSPSYIEPLLAALRERQAELGTAAFSRGLTALAHIARDLEDRNAVRDLLVSHVNHKKRSVQLSALNALGTLEDPKAIPILERFAAAGKESPERDTAERALTSLRAGRKGADFRAFQNDFVEMRKENRDLKKELETLKKRLDAMQPAAPERKPPTPAKKPVRTRR